VLPSRTTPNQLRARNEPIFSKRKKVWRARVNPCAIWRDKNNPKRRGTSKTPRKKTKTSRSCIFDFIFVYPFHLVPDSLVFIFSCSFTGLNVSLCRVYLSGSSSTSVEELILTTYLWTCAYNRKGSIARRFWVESLMKERGQLHKLMLHRVAGGSATRGHLDFAIDRGQVVVHGTGADD